jgi:hypothetical protein
MSSADVKHPNWVLAFLISVSIFGLVLSTFFVLHPSTFEDDFAYRNLTIGSAFSAVCVLGIFATLFPSSCFAILQFWKSNKNDHRKSKIHETILRAHHPSCENYFTHILSIGNMDFCATCSGLLVGATIVLFGTVLYFFASLRIGDPYMLVLIGAAGVALGLLQSALPKFSGGLTRFFASILFVVGTFLVLVSIDMVVKNTSIDLFFVALSVLWILAKITLSQRDHQQICSNCSVKSCRYSQKKG